jgi:hypothetical protein
MLNGDRLRVRGDNLLTEELRSELRRLKPELLELLSSTRNLQRVATDSEPRPARAAFLECVETRRMPTVPNLIRINAELRELWRAAENECGFFLDLAGRQTKPKPKVEYSKVAPSLAAVGVSTHENQAHDQSAMSEETDDSFDVGAALAYASAAKRFRLGEIDETTRDYLQSVALGTAATVNIMQSNHSERTVFND